MADKNGAGQDRGRNSRILKSDDGPRMIERIKLYAIHTRKVASPGNTGQTTPDGTRTSLRDIESPNKPASLLWVRAGGLRRQSGDTRVLSTKTGSHKF